jgi:CRISPR-associated protein Cmr2
MTQHVLLITLGPVQGFIASARRCRDLWFGSWILSELSKAAAAGMVEELGGDAAALEALVFPAAPALADLAPGSPMSVANKLVLRVPGDAARARHVAERGRDAMAARRTALRDGAFDRVGLGDPARRRHFLDQIGAARAQVDELFEYLWVAVAEAEGEDAYAQARFQAEGLLAARKNLRSWDQPSWAGEGVPKSSLDGARESVLHEDLFDSAVTGARRPAALSADERRQRYGVHGAERLCGVGLLKRWGSAGGGHAERFFSTAHVAALPLMIGIDADAANEPGLAAAWQTLRRAAEPATEDLDVVPGAGTGLFGRTDGAILFPQRLSEALEECGHPRESRETEAALQALRSFLRRADRGEPLPYYGILVADGDSMGALINLKKTQGEHRDFSRKLATFARGARGIVQENDGCLLYSGGDDVLAFLPLHRAIECATALAASFAGLTGATLSAGLAVVHFLEPLSGALKVARDAEKLAKHLPGKNALAVAVDKRSGGTTVACDHWEALVPRLLHLITLHEVEAVPDKAGHELSALARLGKDLHEDEAVPDKAGHELAELARLGEEMAEIQRSEALRILGRKRAKRGKEALAKTTRLWLETHLGERPAALGEELSIAALIAQARAQAAPSAKEGQ